MSEQDRSDGRSIPAPVQRGDLRERLLSQVAQVAEGLAADDVAPSVAALALVGAGRALLEDADSALRILVRDARRAGCTWQAVGELLGTTRQAAQQRFGDRSEGGGGEETLQRAARFSRMVVNWWQQGQLKELRASCEPGLAARLGEAQLAEAWTQLEAAQGRLLAQGEPAAARREELLVVDVPLQFEREAVRARVTLTEGGTVTDLVLLRP